MTLLVNSADTPVRRNAALMGCAPGHPSSTSGVPIKHYEEILSARIGRHGGKLRSASGNSVLVEFGDAAEAVNCAISIQEHVAKFNNLHLDEGTIGARIGIHFGELFFAENEIKGELVESVKKLLPAVPAGKIYLTRECYSRVRMHLDLKFDVVTDDETVSISGGNEIYSVNWEAVAGNLKESLKRLGEDDLSRPASLTSQPGSKPSKRLSPIVMIFVLLFIFLVFKFLKWL
jgi:hypothetical protein